MKHTISISIFPRDLQKISILELHESRCLNLSDDVSIYFHDGSLGLFVDAISKLAKEYPEILSTKTLKI